MKAKDIQLRKSRQLFGKIGLTFQVLKTALAAGISWWLANNLIGSPFPVFAPLAAMLVIQVAIFDTIERALYRVLGAVGGVTIGIIISHLLSINALSIALVVLVSFALSNALKFPSYLVIQVAVSALLVLFFSHTSGSEYMWARIFETLIGALVAVVVNIFVLPPNPIPSLAKRVHQLTVDLGSNLDLVSLKKESNKHLYKALLNVRDLVHKVESLYEEIGQAERSLHYSPLQQKHRIEAINVYLNIQTLERVVLQTRGIIRSLLDISIRSEDLEPFHPLLVELMKCVILFGSYANEPNDNALHVLKEAMQHAQELHKKSYFNIQLNNQTINYNVGSIFTDAHRIFEEIDVYTREMVNTEQ